MEKYDHYIDGAWIRPSGGEYFPTKNPYTGQIWADIAEGNADDVDKAVLSAHRAFLGEWSHKTPS